MKTIMIVALIMALCSCSMLPTNEECLDPADYPNSVILQVLDQPCATHKLLVTFAKSAVVLDRISYDDMIRGLNNWAYALELLENVTAGDVKNDIISFVSRYNIETGVMFMIVSDTLELFPDSAVFENSDIKLLRLSIIDIKRHIKKLVRVK